MTDGWDEEAWAAKGWPTSGTLEVTLEVTKMGRILLSAASCAAECAAGCCCLMSKAQCLMLCLCDMWMRHWTSL
jgi:hypothetical protein